MIKRYCKTCGRIFYTYPSRLTGVGGHTAVFCSRECYSQVRIKNLIQNGKKYRYKKGHIPPYKLHPELAPKGTKHWSWKGENVGYRGLHYWLHRVKGIPKKCIFCGKLRTTPKSIQWANIDHKYHRNPNDYIALCASCHKLYDLHS